MSPELDDELSALSAIYGLDVLTPPQHADSDIFVFTTPPELGHQLQIRVRIPPDYPASAKPTVLDGGRGVELVRETLDTVWREGEVCFYDLVEALREVLEDNDEGDDNDVAHEAAPEPEAGAVRAPTPVEEHPQPETTPPSPPQLLLLARFPSPPPQMNTWIIAAPILEKKSVFLAHALRVTTAAEAQSAIKNLLLDKKLKKATHNISAYRIARPNGTTVQDNDDDGETAAGSRLAHLLQVMDVTDVVVVVSRWFGGVRLGPDRFRLINMAAREALVLGGWVEDKEKARERKENEKKEEKEKKAKGKRGKK